MDISDISVNPCNKTFQLEYTYKACELGTKDNIVKIAMNASGTRDTARTVTSTLKKLKNSVQPVNVAYLEKNLKIDQ